jgi:hypothetical protein
MGDDLQINCWVFLNSGNGADEKWEGEFKLPMDPTNVHRLKLEHTHSSGTIMKRDFYIRCYIFNRKLCFALTSITVNQNKSPLPLLFESIQNVNELYDIRTNFLNGKFGVKCSKIITLGKYKMLIVHEPDKFTALSLQPNVSDVKIGQQIAKDSGTIWEYDPITKTFRCDPQSFFSG